MSSPIVLTVSECFIKPSGPVQESNLTPWDIAMLSMHYIQKGLLFKKPSPLVPQHHFIQNLLHNLKRSLSLALSLFYPLAGRLVTRKTQHPPSHTLVVASTNTSSGAKFIYATSDITLSHILSSVDVPPFVHSFFDRHKALNYNGHTLPLLSIQVTELIDAVFIGCSMNHSIADGTSFWNFFNTWSQIFQAQAQAHQGHDYHVPISHHPFHNRWFPEGYGPVINLPFKHHDEFIRRLEAPKLRERIFHFSVESIAKLKERANSESSTTQISSFQSLSALVWRSITRARQLPHDQKTSCKLAINNRPRMEPPLSNEYFGNAIDVVSATTTAVELLEQDLGWAAWKVHLAVAKHNDGAVREKLKEWLQHPVVYQLDVHFDPYSVTMSSSPRFNMYGNEFGMGKAVAVLSGHGNKFDGNVTAYQGYEGGGSIDLEVCLLPDAMSALESDEEFMEAVSVANPL